MSAPDRTLAQFFFEVGYWAALADVICQNDGKVPFRISDDDVEHAWAIGGNAHDDPAEFERNQALADAAPELLEALETIVHWHCKRGPDDEPLPAVCQESEIEEAMNAIAKARGQ